MVAAGILLSRILGLVRNRVFAHYLGTSDAADAFNAAFRIPNILQNLFGEGVLSASFIPVYAGLQARGETREARRDGRRGRRPPRARRIGARAAGRARHAAAHRSHRAGIRGREARGDHPPGADLLPGAGLLVLSAWCLGDPEQPPPILPLVRRAGGLEPRDHRCAARLRADGIADYPLAEIAAWASVAGSLAQFPVQLPTVLRLNGAASAQAASGVSRCDAILRNFWPVFVGRGVVQISAYVDTLLASLLPTGAVAGVAYAQVLYTLPVSLFGMSVSAAELPEMSSAAGDAGERAPRVLRERLARRAPADRVLRGPIGRGVPRARRRGDGRAVPDR